MPEHRSEPLIEADEKKYYSEDGKEYRSPTIRVDDSHSGEEVPVTAQGPGAERVRGFMSNTEIFDVMMDGYGWKR